jgi:hypothetical protein
MRWLCPCDLGLLTERFQTSDEVAVTLKRWNENQLSTNEVVVLLMYQASDEVVVPLILCDMSSRRGGCALEPLVFQAIADR